MKRWIIIAIVFSGFVCVILGDIGLVEEPVSDISDINDVKIKTIYQYKIDMPDGSERVIESETELTEKQYNNDIIKPLNDRIKEIDAQVKAMTIKDNYDIAKPWSLYGKVIQYNYRMILPDGSKLWLNSDVPIKNADCLKMAQNIYRERKMGELSVQME